MAQKYPPNNGAARGFSRNRWYVDEVSGFMIPEDRAVRDHDYRLRDADDVDDPATDDLRDGFVWPVEVVRDDP